MKRIHLFEIEDYRWFPNWIRVCMTRYINAIHKLFGTAQEIEPILKSIIQETGQSNIVDLCSGSGGPMIDVYNNLKKDNSGITLQLSDLYPNRQKAKELNNNDDKGLTYLDVSVDATKVGRKLSGIRTMICSFHHMNPTLAKQILKDAKDSKQPILIYEISDNGAPMFLWWTAIIFNLLFVPIFTLIGVRPLSWKQLIFTYFIPILPLFIAWDGAVSNARTYTLSDLDELLAGLDSDDTYIWKKEVIKGRMGKKIYLKGLPR